MQTLKLSVFAVLVLVLGACSSMQSQRNDAQQEVTREQIALNNQLQSGLIQPGSPAYWNEVRRVRQTYVSNNLPIVDQAFAKHTALLASIQDPAATPKSRASASDDLVKLRQDMYGLLVEVTTFNQQVASDAAQAQQAGYPWHLDYPKLPNTPAQVFTAISVQQIPGFENPAVAPAQPQPVQYIPMAPAAPQGTQGQQGGQPTPVPYIPMAPAPQGAQGQQGQGVDVPVAPGQQK